MALSKTQTYKGIELSYIKILSYRINVDYINDRFPTSTMVDVGIYKDDASRLANINNFVYMTTVRLDGVFADRAAIYAKLKEVQFVGAVDV